LPPSLSSPNVGVPSLDPFAGLFSGFATTGGLLGSTPAATTPVPAPAPTPTPVGGTIGTPAPSATAPVQDQRVIGAGGGGATTGIGGATTDEPL
jgi:hypothetical protein